MPYAVITTTVTGSQKRIEVVLNDLAPTIKYDKTSFYSDDIVNISLETNGGVLVTLKNGTQYILTVDLETSGTIKVDSIDTVNTTTNSALYDTVKAFR